MALLELDGVTRRYGALVALDQVAMRVEEGEVRAVIGPNGAGKTTLFNVITGTVKPSAGAIRFAGQAIAGLASHQICRLGISRTFQITALFPEMSARENARLAAQARHPRRWQPFGGARDLQGGRSAAPMQRSSSSASAGIADRPAGLLSHGDQRLLEVAMAMAQQPRVLLLDEPTQGLSVEETAQAVETLARFLQASRMTVLLVEHDMEVVFRLAHRITVLHRGAVIADGAPDQVKADAARAGSLSRRPRLMLRIEGMNTHYGASHVLQGVDLDMPQGRISAVLGRNGVGKTTMVKTIMGLVVLSGGRVHVGGTDITGWPPHRVAREGVAYVPEGRLIFPDLTVIENIKVGERGPGTAWPLARLLELFPSLRERAASRGSQLSGGEQQMLAIARALVSDPKVMLLDEPSQGLAPLVVRELARVIRLLREEGVTILLVEQNMKLAEAVADELHIMVKGRMVYSATPAVFRAEEETIRARFLTV